VKIADDGADLFFKGALLPTAAAARTAYANTIAAAAAAITRFSAPPPLRPQLANPVVCSLLLQGRFRLLSGYGGDA
jgi:hypothetical protein